MNSFNHYAYGSIGDWLYRTVAGINTDEERTGYKHIYIVPKPGPGLTFAQARYESMYGTIKSSWKKDGDKMLVDVSIPANTTAVVVLPFADIKDVAEGGSRLEEAEGIARYENTEDGVRIELGSGDYSFSYGVSCQKNC